MARTTKSPFALAKAALAAGKRALPDYSHRFSPHKFTQPQLFAIPTRGLAVDRGSKPDHCEFKATVREAHGRQP